MHLLPVLPWNPLETHRGPYVSLTLLGNAALEHMQEEGKQKAGPAGGSLTLPLCPLCSKCTLVL